MRARRCGLVAALLLLGTVPEALAFLVQTFEGPAGKVQQIWRRPQRIVYVLHEAGSADMTPEQTHRLLRESFAVWDQVESADLHFVDSGTTATLKPSRQDRRNLVYFDEDASYLQVPRNAGVIAVTRINSSTLTGEILDADIIFNGRDFRFAQGPDLPPGRIDLKDVAVHEIGHLLGLDHTPLDGPPELRPTMNPFNRGDGPGQGQSLEADDVAGISVLYPASAYLASTAWLSGRVTDVDEKPLFGTHIVAENLDSGEFFSTLSGSWPDAPSPGHYTLRGLSPGRYRLRLEPVEGTINEENFGGIFENFATGFPAEYYDNAEQAAFAAALSVQAAQRLDNIDFVTGFLRPGFPLVRPVSLLANTPNTEGPYQVRMHTRDADRAVLRYRTDAAPLGARLPMEKVGEDLFVGRIPGQRAGTRIAYQVEAANDRGNITFFPREDEWLEFEVVELSGAPLAFTAFRDEDVIGVFDTGDRRELARIPVGDEPIQVLLARDGSRLFVSNLASNEISIIETATFQVLGRIETAVQPLDMALSPDGETLYVANSGAGTLTIVDVDSGVARTAWLANIGSGPYGIAATRERIYATDIARNQVLVIDSSGLIEERIAVPEQPRSLALSPDLKTLYVTSLGAGQLTAIDVNDHSLRRIDLPVGATFAVALSPDGRTLYLTAHDEGTLVMVDAASHQVRGTLAIGRNPRAISFSPDGRTAYITNSFSDDITLVDVEKGQVAGTYASGRNPRGIALNQPFVPTDNTSISGEGATPDRFALLPNYPNPFNASTLIAFSLEAEADLRLEIYNAVGQKVRLLASGRWPAGLFRMQWDGRDAEGRELSSGAYLLVLRTREARAVHKMLLLR